MNSHQSSAQLLILGAGGHAAVVAESAQRAGFVLVGIASTEAPCVGAPLDTLTFVGDPDGAGASRIDALIRDGVRLIAAVGDASIRARWMTRFGPIAFATIVDPSAVLSPSATLGTGVFIGARAVVQARARILDGAILNTACVVEHDCVINVCAHISPAAVLCGGVHVGAHAHVGAGAVIIPAMVIGERARIGAGAVVVREVESDTTVMGVPARRSTTS